MMICDETLATFYGDTTLCCYYCTVKVPFFPWRKKNCMKKVQYAAGVKVKEVALVHITLSILVEVL